METRECQNCKTDFIITPDDFGFYEKVKVPLPTFCSLCRFQKRVMFRNERTLYKRKCDMTGKDMIAIFPQDKNIKVFHYKEWWGDGDYHCIVEFLKEKNIPIETVSPNRKYLSLLLKRTNVPIIILDQFIEKLRKK